MNELCTIREVGYSIDNEKCKMGSHRTACEIKDLSRQVILAISISEPSNRMADDEVWEI